MVWRIGKYSGREIEDVPSSYLKWVVENLEGEELLEAAEEELRCRDDHASHF